MAKAQNPVRGYLRCPVCSSISTVHCVGEGELMASGQPPKNSRNIGLRYYRCPECGNSPMSKNVTNFCLANAQLEKTALETDNLTKQVTGNLTGQVTEKETAGTVIEGQAQTVEVTDKRALAPVTEKGAQTASDGTGNGNGYGWLWTATGLAAVVLFALWCVFQLMPADEQAGKGKVING